MCICRRSIKLFLEYSKIVKSCNRESKVIWGSTIKNITIVNEKDSAISTNKFKKDNKTVKLATKVPHKDRYQSIKFKT